MAIAVAERETPFLYAYAPELLEIKADLRHGEANLRKNVARLRLVRPPVSPGDPSSFVTPFAIISATAGRLASALQGLEYAARTSGLNIEAVIYELRSEEDWQLAQLTSLGAQAEEASQMVVQFRALVREGAVPEKMIAEAQEVASESANLTALNRSIYEAYKQCRQSLEQIRDERLREYLFEWEGYLANLDAVIAPSLAAAVREFWGRVKDDLWAPSGTPRDDSFLMLWDRGRHHLEIELFKPGVYDWFYRDRSDNVFMGGEGVPLKRTPSTLKAVIRKTRKG